MLIVKSEVFLPFPRKPWRRWPSFCFRKEVEATWTSPDTSIKPLESEVYKRQFIGFPTQLMHWA